MAIRCPRPRVLIYFDTEGEAREELNRRMSAPTCPVCGERLEFVKEVEFEAHASRSSITVPLASNLYKCPKDSKHGPWRVYAHGRIEPYRA